MCRGRMSRRGNGLGRGLGRGQAQQSKGAAANLGPPAPFSDLQHLQAMHEPKARYGFGPTHPFWPSCCCCCAACASAPPGWGEVSCQMSDWGMVAENGVSPSAGRRAHHESRLVTRLVQAL